MAPPPPCCFACSLQGALCARACARARACAQSTRRVFNTFVALDEDHNGLLSRREFSQISNGSMSSLFIQVWARSRLPNPRALSRHLNLVARRHGFADADQEQEGG